MTEPSNDWADYPAPDIEHIMRRWLLEEATGNQGATVDMTVAPTTATDVWRWPIRRNTDKAYWEDADDCD